VIRAIFIRHIAYQRQSYTQTNIEEFDYPEVR